MERIDALKALLVKVESGDFRWLSIPADLLDRKDLTTMLTASKSEQVELLKALIAEAD